MAFLSATTIFSLLPFAKKAFHMDDPLFLWVARHIQESSLDFYRFNVNWYGTSTPMFNIMKNPPFTSYYIALMARAFGWGEVPLHIAFLIPALAASLGTYQLARHFCSRPLVAALTTLFTPVFLVSSTNLMCDTMMIGFWVWALVFWLKGVRDDSLTNFAIAGMLTGVCALTKYFGMCLIPLMLVDAIVRKQRPRAWLVALLIPIAILAGYQWYTFTLYGHGLLFDAASYATHLKASSSAGLLANLLVGLAFSGGCLFTAVCYFHLISNGRTVVAGVIGLGLLACVLIWAPRASVMYAVRPEGVWLVAVQIAFYAIIGVALLLVAGLDLWRERDADSLLLFLWIVGTFLFATFFNWTINARSVLPMAPAMGILLMRRLDSSRGRTKDQPERATLWPLGPAAVLALLVALGDYQLANSGRAAAYALREKTKNSLGTLWFEGHWGFQYYMQGLGAKPLDGRNSLLENGDYLAVPLNATNLASIPPQLTHLKAVLEVAPVNFFSTMNFAVGSGFYASVWGPLPFAIGKPDPERYQLLTVTQRIRFGPPNHKETEMGNRK